MGYPIIVVVLHFKKYSQALKPSALDTQRGILFHASSMGEVNAIKPLVSKILNLHPEINVCISTTTLTGLKQAKSITPKLQTCLSVIDIPHLRARQLRQLNPGLVCIVETEIWLNMLHWCKHNHVPVLFINARMSEKSLGRYKVIKPLLNRVSECVQEIHAQSETDAKRFKLLFDKPVYNSGNLKYCLNLNEYPFKDTRREFGIAEEDFVICWGSSRPGEEELLMSIYPKLKVSIPHLKVIIAIRHPERVKEALAWMGSEPYTLLSSHKEKHEVSNIMVIDKLGVLDKAYSICDIAVIGGSFFDFGGHNPLEPAYYEKAVIIGTHYTSCKDSVSQLLRGKGIIVSDKLRLENDILSLYHNPQYRQQLGKNAKQVLKGNQDALTSHYKAVIGCIN